MGLDIYLYRVKKTNLLEEGKKYKEEDITGIINLCRLDICHVDANDKVCETIRNVATRITVTEDVWDFEKIAKSMNPPISPDAHHWLSEMVGGYDGYTVFTFEEKDGERRRVKIDAKQEKDYTTKADFEQLAFIREQVAYQRKGLNDYGWSLLPENCEYDDNLKNVKEMVMSGGLSEEFLDEWVEDETVLWAWW